MGAEQIEHTRVGVQQLFKNVYLVNVSHAAFSQMPDKAACVVESFHGSEVGNSTVLYAAVHHAAAKAACAACVSGFALRSFLAAAVRLYGQAALNACNLGIINVSTECRQHRGIAQPNQVAEQLGFGAVRIFAGNLCHTGYIGQTEEATGILAAVYTAQILHLNLVARSFFAFAHNAGFQRTRKAARISCILYGVTVFISAIYHKAPFFIRSRNRCRMNGRGSSLQHLDQVTGGADEVIQNTLQQAVGGVGIHTRHAACRGKTHITAYRNATCNTAQVGSVAGSHGRGILVGRSPLVSGWQLIFTVQLNLCAVGTAYIAARIAAMVFRHAGGLYRKT